MVRRAAADAPQAQKEDPPFLEVGRLVVHPGANQHWLPSRRGGEGIRNAGDTTDHLQALCGGEPTFSPQLPCWGPCRPRRLNAEATEELAM